VPAGLDGFSHRLFLDVEIASIIAQALLETGIDLIFVAAPAENEFFPAQFAPDRHFDTLGAHTFLL
jgi:hypothetical protein